jgi:ATP-binding cassette subfamily C protein CydC
MSALLYFLPLFKAQAGRFGLALILSLITLAAGAALLGTSGWFITAAAISAAGVSFNIFGPSALVRGFSFIRILARYGKRLVGHDATLKLLSDIRAWLFGRLFPLVPFTANGARQGDLVSRLVADVEALDTVVLVSVGPVLSATAVGAVVASIVWLFLPAAAVVYGITLVLSVIIVPGVYVALSRGPGEAVGIAAVS